MHGSWSSSSKIILAVQVSPTGCPGHRSWRSCWTNRRHHSLASRCSWCICTPTGSFHSHCSSNFERLHFYWRSSNQIFQPCHRYGWSSSRSEVVLHHPCLRLVWTASTCRPSRSYPCYHQYDQQTGKSFRCLSSWIVGHLSTISPRKTGHLASAVWMRKSQNSSHDY